MRAWKHLVNKLLKFSGLKHVHVHVLYVVFWLQEDSGWSLTVAEVFHESHRDGVELREGVDEEGVSVVRMRGKVHDFKAIRIVANTDHDDVCTLVLCDRREPLRLHLQAWRHPNTLRNYVPVITASPHAVVGASVGHENDDVLRFRSVPRSAAWTDLQRLEVRPKCWSSRANTWSRRSPPWSALCKLKLHTETYIVSKINSISSSSQDLSRSRPKGRGTKAFWRDN